MKKLLLITTAFVAVGAVATMMGAAFAADLPNIKGPPVYAPPPVWSWTGCHVGANLGYGWQRNHAYDPNVPADAGTDTGDGIVGGGQLGCDYQVGSLVLGIQGSFDGAGVKGSHLYPGSSTETLGFNTSWLATETGRIGYAVLPQALLYFKGGLAEARIGYTDVDPTLSATSPYWGSASATRIGWTIGGGVEYALTPNWSIFVEYDYMDFGSHNTTLAYTSPIPAAATPYTYNETHNLQTILAGVNYKFDMFAPPAPVVAKY